MFIARDYQQDVIDRVYAAWQEHRGVLAVLSTGGGKTVIFSIITSQHNGAALVTVHRKEIVGQISLALAQMGVKHRIVAPSATIAGIRRKHLRKLGKSFIDPQAVVGVASAQTLTSASTGRDVALQRWLKQVTLSVYDEGHHYVRTGTWSKAVEATPNAKLLFVTACPERADGQGMGVEASGFCDVMVEGLQTKALIGRAALAPFRYAAATTDFDVADLAVTASGDFNAKAFRSRVVESHLIGDVVRHYQEFTPGKKAIVFATDVETANEMADRFNAAGVCATSVDGKTDSGTREKALLDFEQGVVDVLVNVDLFDEGFDVPAVDVAIIARPTQSLNKFLQMIGRALRFVEGKTAVIIDMVRNWERLGMPDWPRIWTLNDRPKGETSGASDTIPQRVCLGCSAPYEAYHRVCPYCGVAPIPVERGTPEQVDGVLAELDVEALSALFEAQRKADCSDEEFQRKVIGQNVPPRGRHQLLRKHQATKYRRKVLKELIAWWVGLQPGRPLDEVQSRFFFRFGIDIGTAHTLNEKDTDALIDTISKRFAMDIKKG